MYVYRHRQAGTAIVVSIGLTAAVAVAIAAVEPGTGVVAASVVVALVVVLLLFHSLTVEVTDDELIVRFGSGPIRKRWRTAEITVARAVRNPWWYGWGIHLTPRGWLYNISGLEAVEVELESGRRFRVGTDEPRRLAQALERAKRRRR